MLFKIAVVSCLACSLGGLGTVRATDLSIELTSAPWVASTALVDACERADWLAVERILDSGAEVDQMQPDGMTALHWAVFHREHKLIERLLSAGADVNATTSYRVSPLSLACEVADVATVKILLAAKADVESRRLGNERPLMIAARRGNKVIVRELIKHGAKVDATESGSQSALMWASSAGHASVVNELLQADAEPSLKARRGFTAMMFAAREGQIDVVKRLLEAGVDVNSVMSPPNSSGRNPRKSTSALMFAVESGHFELAIELIKMGADPNDQRSGYAPLHALSWVRKTKLGDNPEGDPPPRGSGKLTSLEFVRIIVEHGADVNLQLAKGKSGGKAQLNHQGVSPFMFAASTADLPLMKLLLELDADPGVANVDGCTPLMAAAGVGVVAVGEEPGTEEEVNRAIEYLVELGNGPNVVDENGETAMHGAAYRNFPQAVAILARLGADPQIWNRKNKHDWTPHRIAAGYRPGSFKPSPPTLAALDKALGRFSKDKK